MLSGLIDSGYFSRQEILFMRIFWSDDELHRISIKYANDSLSGWLDAIIDLRWFSYDHLGNLRNVALWHCLDSQVLQTFNSKIERPDIALFKCLPGS